MALGTTGIGKMDQQLEEIKTSISFGNEQSECIYSTWNTFQYVAKNLSVWADETIIGAKVKQNVIQLSNALYNLMEATNRLNSKVDTFISKQKELNGYSSNAQFSPGGREIIGDYSVEENGMP